MSTPAAELGTIAVGSVTELASVLSSMSPDQLHNVRLDPALYNALSQTMEPTHVPDVYNINNESVTSTLPDSFLANETLNQQHVVLNNLTNLNQQPILEQQPVQEQFFASANNEAVVVDTSQLSNLADFSNIAQHQIPQQQILQPQVFVSNSNEPLQIVSTSPSLDVNNTQVIDMNSIDVNSDLGFSTGQQVFLDNTALLNNDNGHVISQPILVSSENIQPVFMTPIDSNTPVPLSASSQQLLNPEHIQTSILETNLQNLPLQGILPGQASSLIITPTIMSQVQPTATIQTLNLTDSQVIQDSVPTGQISSQSFITPVHSLTVANDLSSQSLVTSIYPSSININPSLLSNSVLGINKEANIHQQNATIVNTLPNQLILNGNTIIGSVVSTTPFTTQPPTIVLPGVVGNQMSVNNGNAVHTTSAVNTQQIFQQNSNNQIIVSNMPPSVLLPSQTSLLHTQPQITPSSSNTETVTQPQLKINSSNGTAVIILANGLKVELNPEQVQNVLSGKQVVASGRKTTNAITTVQKSKMPHKVSPPQHSKTVVKTVNVISRSEAQVQMVPKSVEQVQPGVFKFQLKQVDENNPGEALKSITVNQPVTVTKSFQTISKIDDVNSPTTSLRTSRLKNSTMTPLGAKSAAEIRRNIISPASVLKPRKVIVQPVSKSKSTSFSSSPQISQLAKDQLLALAKKINNSAQLSKTVNGDTDDSKTVQHKINGTATVDFDVSKSTPIKKADKFRLKFPSTLKKGVSGMTKSTILDAVTIKKEILNGNINTKPTKICNVVTFAKNSQPETLKVSVKTTNSKPNSEKTSKLAISDEHSNVGSAEAEPTLECKEQSFTSPVEDKESNKPSSKDINELKQKKAAIFSKSFKKSNTSTTNNNDKSLKHKLSPKETEEQSFRNVIRSCKTNDSNPLKQQLQLEIENQRKRLDSTKNTSKDSSIKSPTSTTSKKIHVSKDEHNVKSPTSAVSPSEKKRTHTSTDSNSNEQPVTKSTSKNNDTSNTATKSIATSTSDVETIQNPSVSTSVKDTGKESNTKPNNKKLKTKTKSRFRNLQPSTQVEETRKRERPKRFDDFVLPSKPKKEKKTRKFFFPKEVPAEDEKEVKTEFENSIDMTENIIDSDTTTNSEVSVLNHDSSKKRSDNSTTSDTAIPHKKSKQDAESKNVDSVDTSEKTKHQHQQLSKKKVVDDDVIVNKDDVITENDDVIVDNDNDGTSCASPSDENQEKTDANKQKEQQAKNNTSTKKIDKQQDSTKKKKVNNNKKRKKKKQISVELEVLPAHLKTKPKAKIEDSVIDLSKVKLKSSFAEKSFLLNETVDQKTHKLLTKNTWVCTLCGKPGNIGNLDVLFGPYKLPVTTTRSNNNDLIMNVWLHRDCAIWTSTICLSNQTLVGLSDALEAAAKTSCCLCSKVGATLECGFKQCRDCYHFVCAKQRGCSFKMDNFTITCPKHK